MLPRRALLTAAAGAACAAMAQAPRLPAPPPPGALEQETIGERTLVSAVRVDGAKGLPASAFREVAASYEGRGLTRADLRDLERKLTEVYSQRGFVTSGVLFRGVTGGTAVFDAVEGTVTQVRFASPPKVGRPAYLTGLLVPRPDAPVRLGELQERMTALRDAGVVDRIEARLEPLPALGESELVLVVEEPRPWWASVQYDNYHSPSVGARRPTLSAGHRNLTGWGDALDARIGDTDGLEDFRFAYSVPFLRSRWRVGARYERSDSLAIDPPDFRALEITQVAETKALEIQYALPTAPSRPAFLGLSLEQRSAESKLLGFPFSFIPGLPDAETKVEVARAFATASARSDDSVGYARVQVSYGRVAAVLPDIEGAPDKRFWSLLGQFQYARRLTEAGLQFIGRVEGQYTNDTLVPIERFSVGGVNTLRGYRESLIVRDRALIGSVELRAPLWRRGDDIRLDGGVFVDAAWTGNTDGPTGGYPSRLASAGVSAGLALPWGLSARIDYAVPNRRWLTERADVQDRGLHYQISWNFTRLVPDQRQAPTIK